MRPRPPKARCMTYARVWSVSADSEQDPQDDLLSGVSDLDSVRHLIAEMQHDLPGRVQRFRYLADISADLGSEGTMLFGGYTAYGAWAEARSSFVHGNYI